MTIAVIDFGSGNLGSLANALFNLAIDYKIYSNSQGIENCSHIILPGVGSFEKGMHQLESTSLDESIKHHVSKGKPLMGICLGMQLLSSIGHEGGVRKGLNLIPGEVRKLEALNPLRLPHIGWNTAIKCREHDVFLNVKKDVDFYFVHSYHFIPEDINLAISKTEYGENFVSSIGYRNVVGIQFHPEKSQKNGLKIIENFACWTGNA